MRSRGPGVRWTPRRRAPIAPDAQFEITLTKAYAVRAFAPVRKYVVGRFLGTKPPKFKAGKAAGVDWQLCREKSAFGGGAPTLKLTNGGQRAVFNGIREGASRSAISTFGMMQANTTDVCAIPMEQWAPTSDPGSPQGAHPRGGRGAHGEPSQERRATGTRIDALTRAEDEDDGLSDGDAGSDLRAGTLTTTTTTTMPTRRRSGVRNAPRKRRKRRTSRRRAATRPRRRGSRRARDDEGGG